MTLKEAMVSQAWHQKHKYQKQVTKGKAENWTSSKWKTFILQLSHTCMQEKWKHRSTQTLKLTAALFLTATRREQPTCPSAGKRGNQMWSIHTGEERSTKPAAMATSPENIRLNGRSHHRRINNVPSRQIHRDRQQTSGSQGLRRVRMEGGANELAWGFSVRWKHSTRSQWCEHTNHLNTLKGVNCKVCGLHLYKAGMEKLI